MRKYLSLLLLIGLIWGQSSSKPKTNEIVSERHKNGLKKLVLVFEGTGLSETLISKYGFYNNGLKHFIEMYKNNQKHGTSLYWYEDGSKKSESNYSNNKLNGISKSWFSNGSQKDSSEFKDNQLHGIRYEWYRSGKAKLIGNYINGKKEGYFREWDYDGNKFEQNYKDNQLNGIATKFNNKGTKQEEGSYINDEKNGKWTYFDKNGYKKYEIIHPDDYYIEFFSNGQKKIQGYFKSYWSYGSPQSKKWVGLVEQWNVNGEKLSQSVYENGSLNGEMKKFYPNGNIEAQLIYVDNKKHGVSKEFYPNGNNKIIGNYSEDLKDGLFSFYSNNGDIQKQTNYKNEIIIESINFNYYSKGILKSKEKSINNIKRIYQSWYKNGLLKQENNFNQIGEAYGKQLSYFSDGSIELGEFAIYKDTLTMIQAIEIGFWIPNKKENEFYINLKNKIKSEKEVSFIRKKDSLDLELKKNKYKLNELNNQIREISVSQAENFSKTKIALRDITTSMYRDCEALVLNQIKNWNDSSKKEKKKWAKKNNKNEPYVFSLGISTISEELKYFYNGLDRTTDINQLKEFIENIMKLKKFDRKYLENWVTPINPKKKVKRNSNINGTIVNNLGQPIRNVDLKLMPLSNSKPIPKILNYKTRLNGEFEFSNLQSRGYMLTISKSYEVRREFIILNNDLNIGKIIFQGKENKLDNFFILHNLIFNHLDIEKKQNYLINFDRLNKILINNIIKKDKELKNSKNNLVAEKENELVNKSIILSELKNHNNKYYEK